MSFRFVDGCGRACSCMFVFVRCVPFFVVDLLLNPCFACRGLWCVVVVCLLIVGCILFVVRCML